MYPAIMTQSLTMGTCKQSIGQLEFTITTSHSSNILTNSPSTETQTGILISNISDHFFTFTLPNYQKQHQPPTTDTARDFSTTNIDNFKQTLRATTWQSTFSSNDTNDSYNAFWVEFKQAYDTHFLNVTRKNNRNKHKICNFLTQELLRTRSTKLELH